MPYSFYIINHFYLCQVCQHVSLEFGSVSILKQFGEPTRFDPILTSLPTVHIFPQVSDRLFSFFRPDDGTVVKLCQL